jgi:hypothetical protein
VDTLAVRLTVPPAGSVGDLHPQVTTPCRAHKRKCPDKHIRAWFSRNRRIAVLVSTKPIGSRHYLNLNLLNRWNTRNRHFIFYSYRRLSAAFVRAALID